MTLAQQAVVLILSGGGAMAIYTLVKAFLAIRSSTDTREATAIGNLERWRLDADKRADAFYQDLIYERQLSAFWQRRAATVEHVARVNGVDVPPLPPAPKPTAPSPTSNERSTS
jgi:hypothetical protein